MKSRARLLTVVGVLAFGLAPLVGASAAPGGPVSQTATVIPVNGEPDLFPGSTGALTVEVTNPNPYPVTFDSLTPGPVTSDHPAACPVDNITVGPATGLSIAVAARSTSGPVQIAAVVSMAENAPDGCQGAGFGIGLILTGRRS